MGSRRPRPKRLAEKLRLIRFALGLSQTELLKQLETEEHPDRGRISEYEMGRREPTLMTILQYARVAGVHIEEIVDDELDLPENLPGPVRHQVLKRKTRSQQRKQ